MAPKRISLRHLQTEEQWRTGKALREGAKACGIEVSSSAEEEEDEEKEDEEEEEEEETQPGRGMASRWAEDDGEMRHPLAVDEPGRGTNEEWKAFVRSRAVEAGVQFFDRPEAEANANDEAKDAVTEVDEATEDAEDAENEPEAEKEPER